MIKISADGRYIAVGSYDNNVYVYDRLTGPTPIQTYALGDTPFVLDMSADGQYIAVAGSSGDRNVYLFNRSSPTPLWNHSTSSYIYSIAISPDGQHVAAGMGSALYYFQSDNSTPQWNYVGLGSAWNVELSDDGGILAATLGPVLYLFNASASSLLWSYAVGDLDATDTVTVTGDGMYVAVGNKDGIVYLFHLIETGPEDAEIPGFGLLWITLVLLLALIAYKRGRMRV